MFKNADEAEQCSKHYSGECWNYWFDPSTNSLKHNDYTGDDEYGNGCAGPSEEPCPICKNEKFPN